MYYAKHRARHCPARFKRRMRVIMSVTLIPIMLFAVDLRMRPIVRSTVSTQAELLFSGLVSDATAQVIGTCSGDFVTLSTDSGGSVTAIQTDTALVNSFRSQITSYMLDTLQDGAKFNNAIPIGSLTGIEMLAGRGARLPLTVTLAGSVTSELCSEFAEAGINQTRHTIYCAVTAEVFAVMYGHSERITLTARVPVAESVIVGGVPDSFTYVYGDQSDTIGRIFDYGDPYGNDVLSDIG